MNDNYTTFYTENFSSHLFECEGIISLNTGDRFADKNGSIYIIVYKLYNIASSIMIYQGRLLASDK